jgi:hypothetical protein
MDDDFQHGDGTLTVRDPAGNYRPIDTPTGFTDYAFRSIVAAVDALYRLNGKLPSATETHKAVSSWPTSTIAALMLTPEFKLALGYRGVEWDSDSGLSLEQTMALLKLTDWTDRRSTQVKLKELGVPLARHQAWMRQPLYAESYRSRTEEALKDAVPLALNKLMGNVEASDQRAIEKVLEMTGRWNPAQQQIDDVRNIVVRVVEAIIRNVPDPEQRRAILDDIRQATASHELIQVQAIER